MNRKTIPDEIAANELFLCTINDIRVYNSSIKYILENLRKKHHAGTYDHGRAVIAWEVAATREAKLYVRDFCAKGTPYYAVFNAATRRETAKQLEEYFYDDVADWRK